MTCLTLSPFDEQRSGLQLRVQAPLPGCPLEWDIDAGPPEWVETIPRPLVDGLLAGRKAFLEITQPEKAAFTDANVEAPRLRRYFVLLDRLQYHVKGDNPDLAQCLTKPFFRDEARRLETWITSERWLVIYALALCLAKMANQNRFVYELPQRKATFVESAKQPRNKAEGIQHVQREFEESAGLLDLLASELEAAVVNTGAGVVPAPALTPGYLRSLMQCMLGCAQESQLLFHIQQNADHRLCARIGSTLGTAFGNAHNAAAGLQGPQLDDMRDAMKNFTAVKHYLYSGMAQFFFNRKSAGRREKALQLVGMALSHTQSAAQGNRRSAVNEINMVLEEIQRYKQERSSTPRWSGQPDEDDEVVPPSKTRANPRLPRAFVLMRMYNWWRQYAVKRVEGHPSVDEAVDEVLEEDEEEAEVRKKKDIQSLEARKPSTKGREDHHAIGIELITPHQDLFNKFVPDGVGCNTVDVVVRVAPRQRPPTVANYQRNAANVALVLLVDCSGTMNMGGNQSHQRNVVKEMLQSLIMQCDFAERDRVGLVTYTGPEGLQCKMQSMDTAGRKQLSASIGALRPTGGQTSITQGVLTGVEALMKSTLVASSYELMVFTDGHDCDNLNTAWSNWGDYHKLVNLLQEKRSERVVRVNGFAIGDESDKYLVEGVCRRTGGEFTFADADATGSAVIKQWFLNHIANQFNTVGSHVSLEVECRPGVTIRQIGFRGTRCTTHQTTDDVTGANLPADGSGGGSEDLSTPRKWSSPRHTGEVVPLTGEANYCHDWLLHDTTDYPYRTDASGTTMSLDDISVGHATHVVLALGVHQDSLSRFCKELAVLTLRYTDGVTHQPVTLCRVPQLLNTRTLLDRLTHSWLNQAHTTMCHGLVSRETRDTREVFNVNGGDWIDIMDKVEIVDANSSVEVQLMDDTRVRVLRGPAAIALKEVTGGERPTSHWVVLRGTVWFTSSQRSQVVVEANNFHTTLGSNTRATVAVSSGVVRVSCMTGSATVSSTKEVHLPPQKQTVGRDRTAPAAPWQMDEADMAEWLTFDEYLQNTVKVGEQLVRVAAAQSLFKVSELLKRSAHKETPANRRCREFIILHWLKSAKAFLNNSSASDTAPADRVRKILDGVFTAATTSPPTTDRSFIVSLDDMCYSLFNERACGGSDAYLTVCQEAMLIQYADRVATDASSAVGDAPNAERKRREDAVEELFPLWDLDGSGYIEFPEIQQVMLALAGDPDARAAGLLDKWRKLTQDKLVDMRLDAGRLCDLILWMCNGFDGDEFDATMERLNIVVGELAASVCNSRRDRGVWNLFQMWDKNMRGFLDAIDILQVVCHMPEFTSTVDAREHLVEALSAEKMDPVAAQALGAVDPETEMVTLPRFQHFMKNLLGDTSEEEFHKALKAMRDELINEDTDFSNVQHAVRHTTRDRQREIVLQKDMRHVFDGITWKDIERLKVVTQDAAPPHIRRIARPLCVFIGIAPVEKAMAATRLSTVGGGSPTRQSGSGVDQDWWTPLKDRMLDDLDGLLAFLKDFPTISLTYKQVRSVLDDVQSPDFDSNNVLPYSRVVAALVDWAKVMLKLCLIENDWRFDISAAAEPPIPHPADKLLAPATPTSTRSAPVSANNTPQASPRAPSTPMGSGGILATVTTSDRMRMLARLGGGRLEMAADTRTPLSYAAPHARHAKHPNTPGRVRQQRPTSARPQRALRQYSSHVAVANAATGLPTSAVMAAPPAQMNPRFGSPRRPNAAVSTNGAQSARLPDAADLVPEFRADGTKEEVVEGDAAGGVTAVQVLLERHGMSDIGLLMHNEGYDDLADLAQFTMEDPEGFEKLVLKPGHRRKIARLLRGEGHVC